MANPKNIILPEHNSSRLLFIDIPSNVELHITDITSDTTDAQYCTETSEEQYNNSWLLGKLNDKIWFLEDTGIYDSNHAHSAKIWYTDPNTFSEVILYNVKRVFEYGQECDRLYMQHSGGMKLLLLDNDSSYKVNMYIKYERNLPGAFEKIHTEPDGDKSNYYILFYGYNISNEINLNEIAAISYNLNVTTDEVDEDGNPKSMEGINYTDININDVKIDFSQISVNFSITDNDLNDIKIGVVGLNSVNKKFISPYISSNCIEPSYFVLQAPKNRSWICYRHFQGDYYGISYNGRTIDGSICCLVNRAGAELKGYYGIYNLVKNIYEYNIEIYDKNRMSIIEIPKIFENYTSIEYYNSNNEKITYDGIPLFNIFNELDGMHYIVIEIPITSQISKIILKY